MKLFNFRKSQEDAVPLAPVVQFPIKNQDLYDQLVALERERDAVLKECAPFEVQRDALQREVAEAQARAASVGARIAMLKTPHYREVCNSIVVLRRALGKTVSLTAEPGNYS